LLQPSLLSDLFISHFVFPHVHHAVSMLSLSALVVTVQSVV